MKNATYLALIGAVSANTQLTIDLDENALQQTAMDVASRVQTWAGENQDNIMDVLGKLEEVTNETLTRGAATDNERTEALVTILDAYQNAAFADSATCDEQAFADCLMTSGSELKWDRMYRWSDMYETTCASDNGCTAACFPDNESDACNALGDQFMGAAADFETSMATFDQQMQELYSGAFMEKQAELQSLAESFATLSNGLLEDFGCDETCMEDCFITQLNNDAAEAQAAAEENCQWFVDNYPESYPSVEECLQTMPVMQAEASTIGLLRPDVPMCVVTSCCSAVQAVTIGVTQTNIQCQFNQAKDVQCFNADL